MTSLKNQQIDLQCDGEPMDLWERCLALHLVRAGTPINPTCALAMVAGVTHEEADEAFAEMNRRLKNARIKLTGVPPVNPAPHRDILQ